MRENHAARVGIAGRGGKSRRSPRWSAPWAGDRNRAVSCLVKIGSSTLITARSGRARRIHVGKIRLWIVVAPDDELGRPCDDMGVGYDAVTVDQKSGARRATRMSKIQGADQFGSTNSVKIWTTDFSGSEPSGNGVPSGGADVNRLGRSGLRRSDRQRERVGRAGNNRIGRGRRYHRGRFRRSTSGRIKHASRGGRERHSVRATPKQADTKRNEEITC